MLRVLVLALAFAGAAHAGEVTLTVSDPENRSGMVRAGLFDAEGWGSGNPMRAVEGTGVLRFPDVPPGRYAVRLYLDRNGNDRLDTGLMGIPSEPYGFSRDAAPSFGPPAFDAAAVDIGAAGAALTVRLR